MAGLSEEDQLALALQLSLEEEERRRGGSAKSTPPRLPVEQLGFFGTSPAPSSPPPCRGLEALRRGDPSLREHPKLVLTEVFTRGADMTQVGRRSQEASLVADDRTLCVSGAVSSSRRVARFALWTRHTSCTRT
jgi:hypothetical protein